MSAADLVTIAQRDYARRRTEYAAVLRNPKSSAVERDEARAAVAFALEHYESLKPVQAVRG